MPVDGVSLAPLGPADLARITAHTGRAEGTFSDPRPVDTLDRLALRVEDPAAAAMLKGVTPRVLKVVDGACVFLDRATGCTLAADVRPLHCRRFPFVKKGRFLVVRPGGACLAVEEARDTPHLAELLGTTLETLDAIDREMRRKAE